MFEIFREIKLPDIFTFLNLIFGFAGIYYIFIDLHFSVIFLFTSVLMDGADGLVAARYGKGMLGEDLDSLADAVSFGVLPALMISVLSPTHLAIAMIFLLMGVLRLARFNVLKTEDFIGYPITSSALMIGSIIYLGIDSLSIAVLTLIVSVFMVCDLEYLRIKDPVILSVMAIVIVSSFIVRDAAYVILAAAIFYLLSPIPKKVMQWLEMRKRRRLILKRE
jgi:CDP-diacylglycerol--serine O-phosphatidyltransferase